jgi:hypothetical protein
MRGIVRHQPNDGRRRARPQTRLFHRRLAGAVRAGAANATGAPATAARAPQAAPLPRPAAPPLTGELTAGLDLAARRVRAAGGPTDEASYSCACGCVFSAPVSATVACPHCGAEQDW